MLRRCLTRSSWSPLSALSASPDGPKVVVIDALDEATQGGRNELVELIRDQWAHTPPLASADRDVPPGAGSAPRARAPAAARYRCRQ